MAWTRVNTAVGAAGSGATLQAAATNHTAGNLLMSKLKDVPSRRR